MEQQAEHDVLAAIDLGSNSFHMIIARLRDGHFQVMDKLREMVQLRAGLSKNEFLSDEAQDRAIECLQRFGERIKDLPASSVRVVGTNTLRRAKNSQSFLYKARQALGGHAIEIIAGEEEARLIYLGVAHALAFDNSRRLVVDIGGGSTEFIIGEGFSGLRRESLEMGCVSFSQQFFGDGTISSSRMENALIAAATKLRDIQRPYKKMGWIEVVGSSGTIRCVADIVKENTWADDGVITPEALDNLIAAMIAEGHVNNLSFSGLSSERASVLPGGVAILRAAFDRLEIDRMTVSDGALREGLLYDLMGRIQHDDERDRTVHALARRYQVDEPHAERVVNMATQLFEQVSKDWMIDAEEYLDRLQWAAMLHEVGLVMSHDQFHKHSAYLVAHSDMPGFSREEQHALAVIVKGQRRKFPKKDIKKLPEELQQSSKLLTVLLRLAMVFNRGRSEQTDTVVKLKVTNSGLWLTLPEDWLNEHPLTAADLLQEADYLKAIDIKLKIKQDRPAK
ncbi:MAG: exopolyphosphatase [Gammaproteobacteria bacterium]|nr:exopolyphosphatase [Gammaproteobacteria bacterium]MDH5591624.1 exopolyphosphatase [Gammaproteobacteria bacterium]